MVSLLSKTQAQLVDARALREQLLIELAQGADRDSQLGAITREIGDLEQRERYQKDALAKLRDANTAEAKAARWNASRDDAQVAINQARALKERIAKLIEAAAALGNEARAIEAEKFAIGGRLSDLVSQLPVDARSERRINEKQDQLRGLVNQLTAAVPRIIHARSDEDVAAAQANVNALNAALVARLIKIANDTLITLKGDKK